MLVSPYDCQTFSEFLKAEYKKRKSRNGSYSLRAFARDLGLSPSRLCEVLQGNCGVSERTIETVASRLKLTSGARSHLKDLVIVETARDGKTREAACARILAAHRVRADSEPMTLNETHSVVMSVPKTEIPDLKESLKSFVIDQLHRQKPDDRNGELYALTIQIHPVRNEQPT